MNRIIITLFILSTYTMSAQSLYFPPNNGTWEVMSYAESSIDSSRLQDFDIFLENTQTKSIIILKDGKIAYENYYNGHSSTQPWYWASAGKTLTAALVGICQEKGLLDINDYTHQYLPNWTECDTEQIKIIHQLTMTSGLDYTMQNDCTDPECLQCLNAPGEEWYYHNAPYTLLEKVVESATNTNYNIFTRQEISNKIGMGGSWIKLGFNNVYWSNSQSFARFGLLMLANGQWNNDQLIPSDWIIDMTTPSQNINPAYGYLTWLNGQDKFRLPGSLITFAGKLIPNAPDDVYAAIGANSQVLLISPSQNLVIARMGDDPDASPVPTIFINNLWSEVQQLFRTSGNDDVSKEQPSLYPTVTASYFHLYADTEMVFLIDKSGRKHTRQVIDNKVNIEDLPIGMYGVVYKENSQRIIRRVIKY